jgi:hypothetical protein
MANAGLHRGDQHSIIIKTFYIDEPIKDLQDWTEKYFGKAFSFDTTPIGNIQVLREQIGFLLMEMTVHQSETAHSNHKKKKDKEAEREAAQREMKKTADRAKARMSKRATAATTTPETIPI